MRHVVVQGRELEYRDIPASREDRPALVLLHEGLGCVAMWRDFPGRLAAATGCRVVAGSRAGYGGSDPTGTPRQRDYLDVEAREALPAFLAVLGIERPVLVGHSDGATIALLHAAAFPDLPRAVVAMAPHEFVEDATLAGLEAMRRDWERTDLRARLARYHRDPDRVFHEWNDTWLDPAFRDWNVLPILEAIRCPVLALQGQDDEYATPRQVEAVGERVPGARVLLLPSCGHVPHRDQPDAVLAAVAGFIGP